MVVILCTALLVLAFHENAAGADFDAPPTARCHYRLAIRGSGFCAAALYINPLFGPTGDTLGRMGAVSGDRIVRLNEVWRLASAIFLHSGAIHLLVNMTALLSLGFLVERHHGFWRFGAVFLFCGFSGCLATATFEPDAVAVGASGAVCGLVGAAITNCAFNWDALGNPFLVLASLALGASGMLLLGNLPMLDNFTHSLGFIMGLVSGLLLLARLRKVEGCLHTCMRRTMRLFAAIIAFSTLVACAALMYGVGGTDASEMCPACRHISCRNFPWGCHAAAGDCWWTCDSATASRRPCVGDVVLVPIEDDSATGTVALECPFYFEHERGAASVTVVGVNVTDWGPEQLERLCQEHCHQ